MTYTESTTARIVVAIIANEEYSLTYYDNNFIPLSLFDKEDAEALKVYECSEESLTYNVIKSLELKHFTQNEKDEILIEVAGKPEYAKLTAHVENDEGFHSEIDSLKIHTFKPLYEDGVLLSSGILAMVGVNIEEPENDDCVWRCYLTIKFRNQKNEYQLF